MHPRDACYLINGRPTLRTCMVERAARAEHTGACLAHTLDGCEDLHCNMREGTFLGTCLMLQDMKQTGIKANLPGNLNNPRRSAPHAFAKVSCTLQRARLACAMLRMWRSSAKFGGTYVRRDRAKKRSYSWKASTRLRGVKKEPRVGTMRFNLLLLPSRRCSTIHLSSF